MNTWQDTHTRTHTYMQYICSNDDMIEYSCDSVCYDNVREPDEPESQSLMAPSDAYYHDNNASDERN